MKAPLVPEPSSLDTTVISPDAAAIAVIPALAAISTAITAAADFLINILLFCETLSDFLRRTWAFAGVFLFCSVFMLRAVL